MATTSKTTPSKSKGISEKNKGGGIVETPAKEGGDKLAKGLSGGEITQLDYPTLSDKGKEIAAQIEILVNGMSFEDVCYMFRRMKAKMHRGTTVSLI